MREQELVAGGDAETSNKPTHGYALPYWLAIAVDARYSNEGLAPVTKQQARAIRPGHRTAKTAHPARGVPQLLWLQLLAHLQHSPWLSVYRLDSANGQRLADMLSGRLQ